MKEIIKKARQEKYAIPQFNTNGLEWTRYILEQCQASNSPVIIGVSPSAISYIGGCQLVRNIVDNLKKELKITIPVLLHLDHGTSFELCKEAYDAGFESIMIDGSKLSIEENIDLTNKVKDYCKNAIIEAEIGQINTNTHEIEYTSPAKALEFYNATNVDLLAPSVGSVHGIYKGEPKISFETISKISQNEIYTVLHGGSGLDRNIIRKCIDNGILKININTELQIAWSNAVKKYIKENPEIYDPRKIIASGSEAIKDVISNYIDILGSKNKG